MEKELSDDRDMAKEACVCGFSPASSSRREEDGSSVSARRLGELLGDAALASRLVASGRASPRALTALAALAEQSVRMGIDYSSLGIGWDHPNSRMAYRTGSHRSTMAPASRNRAEASRRSLAALVAAVGECSADAEDGVTEAFIREIGLRPEEPAAKAASFEGVAAALEAELLLPLRALNEGEIRQTMKGVPLPTAELRQVVRTVTGAVLSRPGGFSDWRYGNPLGQEQLRGLTTEQLRAWREPMAMEHPRGVRTHEDAPGELGFFWATKIGGPSHGFDYESQCILPLLANARHKVILLSDPGWPHHPAGRAHWRLLWSLGQAEPEPRLWLETVNCDFDAHGLATEVWALAALRHALTKAVTMRVPLSMAAPLAEDLRRVAESQGFEGEVRPVQECMLLRPSNAVVEASDYLSPEHDWIQRAEEVTGKIPRCLFIPRSK
uniref:Uncharacterized protein n=2 Tax=Alexandrium monilatum TaxID=311494 RepID=A0A7S4W576_9DINO